MSDVNIAGPDVITAVDTALGCPYGLAAEQTVAFNDSYVADAATITMSQVGEGRFFATVTTAVEADEDAEDIARGILGCVTCQGDPHSVDLKNKVCAFALEAVTGASFLAPDVREILESRDQDRAE